MGNLTGYQTLVDNCADQDSTELIPNAGEKHAAIAMAKLLDKTIFEAKIVCGSFSHEVCNQPNYIKSLKSALERNVTFKVMCLDKVDEKSEAYLLLKNSPNATFLKPNEKFEKLLLGPSNPIHFSVFDNKMFRMETNPEKFTAIFCFNDVKHAEKLSQKFDEGVLN